MKKGIHIYRLLNLLSIDVAFGAAICAVVFARILEVKLLPQAFFVLGTTVWIIYTTDHLIDAAMVRHSASSERHRFHQEHFQVLLVALIMACLAALTLAFFIRRPVLESGLVFACFVGLYIFFNRRLRYFKEFMAALLYSGGVLLPAWSLFDKELTPEQQTLIAQFVILVFINLLLFAWLSYQQDILDGQRSLATVLGKYFSRMLIFFLFVSFGVLAFLPGASYWTERAVLLAMASVLLLIFVFPNYFQTADRFRLVGDAVFLFPLVALMNGH